MDYLSLSGLRNLGIDSLPKSVRGLAKLAQSQSWQSRPRTGRGGGNEYLISSMPADIQAAILARRQQIALQNAPALPQNIVRVANSKPNKKMLQLGIVPAEEALKQLDDEQKACAFARIALVSYVLHLYHDETMKLNLHQAADYVAEHATAGTLPADKQAFVAVANNRTGAKRQGLGGSTLFRWVSLYRKVKGDTPEQLRMNQILAMAHDKTKRKMALIERAWLPDFQRYYNTPNKLTISQALGLLARDYAKLDKPCPSYDMVQRVLKSMSVAERERGRVTGSEYRQFLPYIERDWQALQVHDVWIGDGHSFKATVQHPDHGRPFTPEITMILDGCSGLIVGWSVKLSESALAVADAFRDAMTHYPPPLGYYSDNGSGETADMLDREVTGIFPRLGIEHMTGIPGNPQGRGRIERLWKTTLIPLAKLYPTYKGRDADSGTLRKVTQAMTSMIKAENRGDALNDVQAAAKAALPKWKDFLLDLEACVKWYNTEHEHRSLPKNPQTGRHFTPQAYYDFRMKKDGLRVKAEKLSPAELDFFYRPEEERKTRRGLVMLWGNSYFSTDLAAYHGQKVRVSYDIHNADSVIVKDMDGRIIAKAQFGGNRKAAFAQTRMEQLAERRRQSQLRLLELKKEVVELERLSAVPMLEAKPQEKWLDDLTFTLPENGYRQPEMEILPPEPIRQPSELREFPENWDDEDGVFLKVA